MRARTASSAAAGLPCPVGTVAHDARVQGIDANRRQLDGERVDEAGDAAVDVLTVVEPGYGRRIASPPKSTIEALSVKRGRSAWMTSVYPTSFSVTSRSARATS